MMKRTNLFLTLLCLSVIVFGQKSGKKSDQAANKTAVSSSLDGKYEAYKTKALQIWEYAEVGYKETKSSALLQETLKENGFTVTAGIAGMPTAFEATYGSGAPVIAILAEYDALPGMSQNAVPEKSPIEGKIAGHACGHHVFGVASIAAGIEIKNLIEQGKFKGTIKVLGCPAEEGGSGKVFLVREGYLNNVDAAIHWHASDANNVTTMSALANKSAKFKFYGFSAHAAAAPEKGRSALDAVEAMTHMVNMMREHVPQETRIHYVITSGGKAPNIVPDFAEVYFYVRNPKKDIVMDVFDRVVKVAEGAALGTGTTMDYEIIGGTHDLLINNTLAMAMQTNLEQVGGVKYTAAEVEFAKKIQTSFTFSYPAIATAAQVKPLDIREFSGGGSTDVGDVSYAVPTVGLRAASWVPGVPAHSWQAVACGGTEIATKGMLVAAKTMAQTAVDLYTNPELIEKAKAEFKTKLGDYQYKALLGDIKPALNYRD
jgi:aminobenzoyl-glutamate utilization protein B